jgi:hypothetical protein
MLTAMRLCLERLLPPVKTKDDRSSCKAMGDSLADNARAVVSALAAGEITPEEAGTVLAAFASQVRVVQATEIEERMAALEAATQKGTR